MPSPQPSSESTASADTLDFAVLAALADGPSEAVLVSDVVRELCRPWLHPTAGVVHTRLARQRGGERIVLTESGALALTSVGRELLRRLICGGVRAMPHGLAELCESLRLALFHHLSTRERQALHADLLLARARCLACQRQRLDFTGERRAVVQRARQSGVALAEVRLAALRGLLGQAELGDAREPGLSV